MKKIFFLLIGAALLQVANAQDKKNFTLEDIFKNGTFAAKGAPGFEVMNNGISYSIMMPEGEHDWKICRIDLETGKDTQVIFSSTSISRKIDPESYEFSNDEKYILLTTQTERIYRHSTRALAFVVNIEAKTITEIGTEKVMYPTISPNNSMVAYVKENNMYVMDLNSGKEMAITTDGKKNEINNGAVDWVYEEEFTMSRGFEWSPDSKYIAYYRFDESKVKEFSMTMYGGLYPGEEKWKYPKAGEDNSKVDVFIYNTENRMKIQCKTGSENDQYLPRIQWTQNPGYLSIQKLNRWQNEWTLMFAQAETGATFDVLKETSKTYVDISDNLRFLKNKNCFLYTSEKSGFNHIYLVDFSNYFGKENIIASNQNTANKGKETQITTGNWEVLNICAFDEKKGIIFFTSTEASSIEDHLYSINLKGKDKKSLTPEPGNHMINFSKSSTYFTDITSTINTPYKYSLRKAHSDWQRVLEDNENLKNTLGKYNFGSSEFSTMTTTSGTTLNYWIMKPYNFDPNKKYPVLMHVYGGPGINTVRNNFGGRNYYWHQYLTQMGYIVISVDNRGTGHRGEEFKKCTYLNLGKLEHQDQTDAAKWIGSQPWADPARIGIWGWSFGGYMSSLCITKSNDVFKTAIAVAPVTNWRYYDNIYTERFLRRPADNADGYDQNSPINFVKDIKGNYLLIHGTGDDNVHFQNSVEMVNAMIKAGVKFDSEYYPNRNHGIGDRPAQYHLYRRMTDYLLEKL